MSTARLAVAILLLSPPLAADSRNQQFSDFTTPLPVAPGETLILGIVGGWERWDNPGRGVRRTALEIRARRLPGVHVETVENHKLPLAEALVRRAFDFDRDGVLAPAEAARARVLVFGQSLGGRAALRFARTLHEWNVPIRLLIVVDSIGRDSYVVPANTREAANYYQREHLFLKGASRLIPADSSRTRIVENLKFSLRGRKDVQATGFNWLERFFLGRHARTENLPEIWGRVTCLLTSAASSRD